MISLIKLFLLTFFFSFIKNIYVNRKKNERYHKNVLKIKCLKLYFELKKSPEIFNHYFAFVYLLFKKRCSSMVFWKQYYTYLTVISCPYISNLLMALGVMGPQNWKTPQNTVFSLTLNANIFFVKKNAVVWSSGDDNIHLWQQYYAIM